MKELILALALVFSSLIAGCVYINEPDPVVETYEDVVFDLTKDSVVQVRTLTKVHEQLHDYIGGVEPVVYGGINLILLNGVCWSCLNVDDRVRMEAVSTWLTDNVYTAVSNNVDSIPVIQQWLMDLNEELVRRFKDNCLMD